MSIKVKKIFDLLRAQMENEEDICFQSFSEKIGVSAFSVADLNHEKRSIVRAQSSMCSAWISHYVDKNFMEVDPFLESAFSGEVSVEVMCGMSTKSGSASNAAYNLNHGLKDAGYTRLVGTSFRSSRSPVGRFISLSFEGSDGALDNSAQLAFSSILNSFIDFNSRNGITQFFPRPSPLSLREKDTLSFLAEGWNISQIGHIMGISDTMVHRHLTSSQNKLHAKTREQLIVVALQCGYIDP